MESNTRPSDGKAVGYRVELSATLLLGVATVAIAWATFRGTVYDDRVAENFHDALVLSGDANDAFGEADTRLALEQSLFLEWLQTEPESEAESNVERVMDPALIEASYAWEEDEDYDFASPFDDPDAGLSSTELYDEADRLAAEIETYETAARDADRAGDLLGLSQVLFAVTLFSAGMAVILKTPRMQWAVLVFGSAILLVGVVVFAAGEAA